MIYLVDQERLLSAFCVDSFELIEDALYNSPPSMNEYHLNNIIQDIDNDIYINKNNIQQTIQLDSYNIFIDYDFNTYIEQLNSNNYDENTQSLW